MIRRLLIILCLGISGCSTAYYYPKNARDVEDQSAPARSIFDRSDTPAIVVHGTEFEGKRVQASVINKETGYQRDGAEAVLPSGAAHWWTFSNLPPGKYRVNISVEGDVRHAFEITVLP